MGMVEYFERPEIPGVPAFRCVKLSATLSVTSCATMWKQANHDNVERLNRCKTCPIGAVHAGETAASTGARQVRGQAEQVDWQASVRELLQPAARVHHRQELEGQRADQDATACQAHRPVLRRRRDAHHHAGPHRRHVRAHDRGAARPEEDGHLRIQRHRWWHQPGSTLLMASSSTATETPTRWVIADHICRICLSRVLERATFDSQRKVYRCSNCETEAEGPGPQVLCCCGMKIRAGRDLGVRCVPNPRRTPENPARIVAQQVDAVDQKTTPR